VCCPRVALGMEFRSLAIEVAWCEYFRGTLQLSGLPPIWMVRCYLSSHKQTSRWVHCGFYPIGDSMMIEIALDGHSHIGCNVWQRLLRKWPHGKPCHFHYQISRRRITKRGRDPFGAFV
jgi:hypothetical protein